jgi:hypothetical protein
MIDLTVAILFEGMILILADYTFVRAIFTIVRIYLSPQLYHSEFY